MNLQSLECLADLKAAWKEDLKKIWNETLGNFSFVVSSDKKVYLKNYGSSETLAVISLDKPIILNGKGVQCLDEITPILKFLDENLSLLISLEII